MGYMSTDLTLRIESTSLENTLQLAASLGAKLHGGEVIELVSDLGGGKTAFVRGLAQGLGSNDTVSSPSFTISNQYTSKNLTIHHFDFYRLNEAGIIKQELQEIIDEPNAITVVEWADIIEAVLPKTRLTIQIRTISEEGRIFTLTYPESLSYLVPIEGKPL